MLTIYKKNMRKYWLIGISFPLVIVLFIPLIAFIWPELKESISAFADILESPIYQVILGELSMEDLSTWQGMFFMYIFMMLEWVMIFATIFIPARLISSESDNRTLDVMLSYPVPRWRYMLEKFSVYLTYNLLYPIMIIISTMFFTELIGEEIDLLVVGYAAIGSWFLFFTLGAISLLCGTLFLESNRAMAISGLVILTQYMMERFGGIVESVNFLQDYSVFHYLTPSSINASGTIPFVEIILVFSVGLFALLGAMYVFQNRELT